MGWVAGAGAAPGAVCAAAGLARPRVAAVMQAIKVPRTISSSFTSVPPPLRAGVEPDPASLQPAGTIHGDAPRSKLFSHGRHRCRDRRGTSVYCSTPLLLQARWHSTYMACVTWRRGPCRAHIPAHQDIPGTFPRSIAYCPAGHEAREFAVAHQRAPSKRAARVQLRGHLLIQASRLRSTPQALPLAQPQLDGARLAAAHRERIGFKGAQRRDRARITQPLDSFGHRSARVPPSLELVCRNSRSQIYSKLNASGSIH